MMEQWICVPHAAINWKLVTTRHVIVNSCSSNKEKQKETEREKDGIWFLQLSWEDCIDMTCVHTRIWIFSHFHMHVDLMLSRHDRNQRCQRHLVTHTTNRVQTKTQRLGDERFMVSKPLTIWFEVNSEHICMKLIAIGCITHVVLHQQPSAP